MAMDTTISVNVVPDFFAMSGKHQHRFATSETVEQGGDLPIQETSSSSATRQA